MASCIEEVPDDIGTGVARVNVVADIEGARAAETDHRHGFAAGRDRLADEQLPGGRPCGRHEGSGTKRAKRLHELTPGESCRKCHYRY